MKTRNSIIAIFVLLSNLVIAQGYQKDKNVEQMHEQKWQYIVGQSKLNTAQINAVYPIFLDYENTMWKQHLKNREFYQSVHNNDKETKPNYQALNDRYADSELLQAQQFKIYHLKLRKILDSETLFNYYKAERDFKRKLLKDFPGKGKGRK